MATTSEWKMSVALTEWDAQRILSLDCVTMSGWHHARLQVNMDLKRNVFVRTFSHDRLSVCLWSKTALPLLHWFLGSFNTNFLFTLESLCICRSPTTSHFLQQKQAKVLSVGGLWQTRLREICISTVLNFFVWWNIRQKNFVHTNIPSPIAQLWSKFHAFESRLVYLLC